MTLETSINCPNCGAAVEISEVLYRRAEGNLRARWEQQTKEQVEQASRLARETERAAVQQQLSALTEQLAASKIYVEEAQQKERELQQRTLDIERQKAGLEAELEKKLRLMVGPLKEELKLKIAEESRLEVVDLKTNWRSRLPSFSRVSLLSSSIVNEFAH
jgi:hypothetical protein